MVPSLLRHLERLVGFAIRKQVVLLLVVLTVFSSATGSCANEAPATYKDTGEILSLSSNVFSEGGKIPVQYTCDGEDISPPLAWGESPEETQAFVLIVDDPDAPGGVFTHWVLYNIPGNIRQLNEGVPTREQLDNGTLQGENDFGRIGYNGPCPPRGPAHRYCFTLYALDKVLDVKSGLSKRQLLETMDGCVLAQGQLIGTYYR